MGGEQKGTQALLGEAGLAEPSTFWDGCQHPIGAVHAACQGAS